MGKYALLGYLEGFKLLVPVLVYRSTSALVLQYCGTFEVQSDTESMCT